MKSLEDETLEKLLNFYQPASEAMLDSGRYDDRDSQDDDCTVDC